LLDQNPKIKDQKQKWYKNREMIGTLSLTLTLLLGETHVGLTTLCGIHFQCVVPTWILPNKRVIVRESVRKRVSIVLLIKIITKNIYLPSRWLKTLGSVATYYNKLTMSFFRNGEYVHLSGLHKPCPEETTLHQQSISIYSNYNSKKNLGLIDLPVP